MQTSSQRRVIFAAFGTALLMIAQHVAAKATRDALFLSAYPASALPRVMIAGSLLAIGGTILLSRLLARHRPGRVVPGLFAASAALYLLNYALCLQRPRLAAVSVFLQISVFGPLVASGFWTVVSERFDPHTAKQTVARIAAAAALGGVVGGVGSQILATQLGVSGLLPILCLLHGGCIFGVLGFAPREPARAMPTAPASSGASGLTLLLGHPYLRQMAGLLVVCCLVDSLLDYALKAAADAAFANEQLIHFFAVFYTLTGVLSFVLQASLGHRLLRRFGLGGAMAVLPGVVLLTGLLASGVTRLWSLVLVRAAESVVSTSFFNAGYQLLYTPLPAAIRRPVKPYVDVGAQRVGEVIGAGSVLLLLLALPDVPLSVVVGMATVASGAGLWMVVELQRGYVRQLAAGLRSGEVSTSGLDVLDATTAHTIMESQLAIDREELLTRVRELSEQRSRDATTGAATPAAAAAAAVEAPSAEDAALIERVAALYSRDPVRIRRVLESRPDDPRLVAHVVPLLATSDGDGAPIDFLRRVADRCTGQLVDLLLDRAQPLAVRRSLPTTLEHCRGARSVEGLCRGLEDADFELRVACARAAARVIARAPELAVDPAVALARVEAELDASPERWRAQAEQRPPGRDRSLLYAGYKGPRTDRCVEHVFTLLALAGRAELIGSALRGVLSDDPKLRGTALEYLDSTLPAALWRRLEPLLAAGPTLRPAAGARSREHIARELLESSASLELRHELQRELRGEPDAGADDP